MTWEGATRSYRIRARWRGQRINRLLRRADQQARRTGVPARLIEVRLRAAAIRLMYDDITDQRRSQR